MQIGVNENFHDIFCICKLVCENFQISNIQSNVYRTWMNHVAVLSLLFARKVDDTNQLLLLISVKCNMVFVI